MSSGRVGASYKEAVARRLRLPKPWRIEVELYSPRLGVRGVADIVAGRRRYIVVEVKRYARRRDRHFKAQLMIYALLVRDVMGPVEEAVLVEGGKVQVYRVTAEDLAAAERIVGKVRRILESEEPPIPLPAPGKCNYCWYRRLCPSPAVDPAPEGGE